MTGNTAYSTSNVTAKGAPTLQELQRSYNASGISGASNFKVGYIQSSDGSDDSSTKESVYDSETGGNLLTSEALQCETTGWVYSIDGGSTWVLQSENCLQNSSTNTYNIDSHDKAWGYWLARCFS